jgi:hypothetical protein
VEAGFFQRPRSSRNPFDKVEASPLRASRPKTVLPSSAKILLPHKEIERLIKKLELDRKSWPTRIVTRPPTEAAYPSFLGDGRLARSWNLCAILISAARVLGSVVVCAKAKHCAAAARNSPPRSVISTLAHRVLWIHIKQAVTDRFLALRCLRYARDLIIQQDSTFSGLR